MSKILVAGAGHGGLVAAIHLAKNGYNITVVEKDNPDTLGHDWHDWLNMDAFDRSGIDRPHESTFFAGMPQGFRNPKGTVMLRVPVDEGSICMDRKLLISYLISLAEEAGVTHGEFTVLKFFSQPPCDVLRNAPRLLLAKAR